MWPRGSPSQQPQNPQNPVLCLDAALLYPVNPSFPCSSGKRGLDALSHINLPPPSSGGRAVATITTGSSPTPNSNAANSTSTNTPGIAGVWGPGSANLGVPPTPVGGGTASSTSGSAGAKAAGQGLSEMTELSSEPLPGLTLLQGMVVMGAGAARREEYSRPASRSKPKSEGAALTGGMTAGVGEPHCGSGGSMHEGL